MAKGIKFSKMHGCGNSFVMIDDRKNKIDSEGELAAKLCSYQFGIGADGMILVRSSKTCNFRMDYFNSDGSIGEMCGNGIRCFAKFVKDQKLTKQNRLSIETLAGRITTNLSSSTDKNIAMVTVDMGSPQFSSKDIKIKKGPALNLKIGSQKFAFISMGNPHAVTFVRDFNFNLAKEGSKIENKKSIFPNKTNVEYVKIISPNEIQVRVWERGCGITLACGTGACASVVAASIKKKIERGPIKVIVDGGELEINWDRSGSGHVFMSGPAETVAVGEILA